MSINQPFARRVRLRRMYGHGGHRMLVVPLDHSISTGPITGGEQLDNLVGRLAGNGVDAVALHKGSLRHVNHQWFARMSLIVHLSASTVHAADPDAKYLVASVEESLRLGADAVSVHVNLGSHDEERQIADLAAVSDACDRWNVPLLAMMYPRGPKIDPKDPGVVAHAVSLAADLGADIAKTVYVGSVGEMADIVRESPIPVIVAGGPRTSGTGELLSYVDETLRAGTAGVAIGRNIFETPDPGAVARRVADLVHRDRETVAVRNTEQLAIAAG